MSCIEGITWYLLLRGGDRERQAPPPRQRSIWYRSHVRSSPDTDAAAAELQARAYCNLGESGRLKVALELSDLTHAFAVAGIKARDSIATDAEARRVLASALYGSASTDTR